MTYMDALRAKFSGDQVRKLREEAASPRPVPPDTQELEPQAADVERWMLRSLSFARKFTRDGCREGQSWS